MTMSIDPRKPPKIEPYSNIFFIEGPLTTSREHEVWRVSFRGTRHLVATHRLKLVAKLHAWWVGAEVR